MDRLSKLTLRGFKTIRNLDGLELGPLNVLIGANGSGKSNLIHFFRMLNAITSPPGELQLFVAKEGGANALLSDGAEVTNELDAELTFAMDAGEAEYAFRLRHGGADTLYFAGEKRNPPIGDRNGSIGNKAFTVAQISTASEFVSIYENQKSGVWNSTFHFLHNIIIHHFHNTSKTARIRQKWDIEDNRRLKHDGGNLAPVLWRLQRTRPEYYQRIVLAIQQLAPFFADFVFEDEFNKVLLQWRENGSDVVFGSHQASDGLLRLFALVTLLLWPEDDLPSLIILDEPELGLHPKAVQILAGLIRSLSLHTQIILATQSSDLVDCFEPEDLVVVDRSGRETTFNRLSSEELADWLDDYSLSQLWDKNVLGGRP